MWPFKRKDVDRYSDGTPRHPDGGYQPKAPPVRVVCDSRKPSAPPGQPALVEYRNKLSVHYNDPYCSYLPPLGAKVVIWLQGVELTVVRTDEPIRKKYEDDLVYELPEGGYVTGRFKWRHV